MYELTGRIKNIALDFSTGKPLLTLLINEKRDAGDCFDKLHDAEKVAVKIDKYREKRSLNANAYAWLLIGKIGDLIRASKEDVYLEMLKRYGQSAMISIQAQIPFTGFVKYCEEVGESKLNGKLFKHYKCYKGSSEYDTREMSIFIDGIVSEAQELGIQTKTPAELAELKSLWGE